MDLEIPSTEPPESAPAIPIGFRTRRQAFPLRTCPRNYADRSALAQDALPRARWLRDYHVTPGPGSYDDQDARTTQAVEVVLGTWAALEREEIRIARDRQNAQARTGDGIDNRGELPPHLRHRFGR